MLYLLAFTLGCVQAAEAVVDVFEDRSIAPERVSLQSFIWPVVEYWIKSSPQFAERATLLGNGEQNKVRPQSSVVYAHAAIGSVVEPRSGSCSSGHAAEQQHWIRPQVLPSDGFESVQIFSPPHRSPHARSSSVARGRSAAGRKPTFPR